MKANKDKWISVADKLPKVGQMVNCYGSEWPEGCSCKYTENGFLWPNVTHWQPLPHPPEKKITYKEYVVKLISHLIKI